MDKPISTAVIALQTETATELPSLEQNLQQALNEEAFDAALQQADQRQIMGDTDRLVAAGIDHAKTETAISFANAHALSGTCAETWRLRSTDNNLNTVELVGDNAEQSRRYLSVREPAPSGAYVSQSSLTVSGSIENEVLAFLKRSLDAPNFQTDQTLSLEFVDDPNGILGIELAKDKNNSWSINLTLSEAGESVGIATGENQQALSTQLVASLQQNGFSVAALNIEVRALSNVSTGAS